VPPLDGQPAEEIVAAMLAYRTGERGPTVMDRIAKGFTDNEIREIAGWLAGRGR
jgi:cytochrome c553